MTESESTGQEPYYDSKAIELKWQGCWRKAGIFRVRAEPGREKFFVNFPYPYMNGFLHVGHTFSLLRLEFAARYMRLKGRNVLFPFSFHSTGMPIVAAAERVKNREPKQLAILASMDIPPEEVPFFEKPENWPAFFIREALTDLKELGLAVDWSRSFTTTSLNPYYSKFIEWQFRKLQREGYVTMGEFPVVWCENCNSAVGDHARSEGEGVRPQEFTILKFRTTLPSKYDKIVEERDVFLLAATLRPETVFGQTNLWIDPEEKYLVVERKDNEASQNELWIMSEPAFKKLLLQKKGLTRLDTIKGKELVGRPCVAPMIHREIPILPSGFCDPEIGTGIVSSVPSDAPDDWIALEDLKRDSKACKKHGFDPELVQGIQPIAIISSQGWGPFPAEEICKKLGVENQFDREKLVAAKKEIYKTGFYTGRMQENCGDYAGMPVAFAKKEIGEKMVDMGDADLLYELPEPVVCRCLNPVTVKIVNDQWFIRYSDEEWKAKTRKALAKMNLYPPLARKQFEHVVEWLQNWACARKKGLGTSLPWDLSWLIESLSDSTIYMAFYTISWHFNNWMKTNITPDEDFRPQVTIKPEQLSDAFFDYVFLGTGDPVQLSEEFGIPQASLKTLRQEFSYWYPFDLRGSGKDLIQNHLGFCLFNHTAIFPEKYWPRGFTLNGWIKVQGEKMSKSRGNFFTLRDMLKKYGADITRITLANAGEGINDPNLEITFAKTTGKKLMRWFQYSLDNFSPKQETKLPGDTIFGIDRWFLSRLNRTCFEVDELMSQTNFKSALRVGFFDLQNDFRWYLRRAGKNPNPLLVSRMIKTQALLLSPFVPHYVEELMERLGFGDESTGFLSKATYPEVEDEWLSREEEVKEDFFKAFMEDIRNILQVTGISPGRIIVYTSPDWMYEVAQILRKEEITDLGKALGFLMREEKFRKLGKQVPNFVKRYLPFLTENARKIPQLPDEKAFYLENVAFLQEEFGCTLQVFTAGEEGIADPAGKAKAAVPYRPGIYVE